MPLSTPPLFYCSRAAASLLLLAVFLWHGCKKDDTAGLPAAPAGRYEKGIWVLNEGTYNFGNASLDHYLPDSDRVETNVFTKYNGRPLGDVLQSMVFHNELYYLVVNNSGRIEAIDPKTLKTTAVLKLPSPRYILPLSESKAYVSDFASQGIHVVDLKSLSVIKKIDWQKGNSGEFSGWTEQMLRYKDLVFVLAPKEGKLLVADTRTDAITDTVDLHIKPKWMRQDKEGKLWVLCEANYEQQLSYLYRIDPDTRQILAELPFADKTANPGGLCLNPAADTLYFFNNKAIYRMGIHETALPAQPLIAAAGRNYYGLGVDPKTGTLYAGDAVDNVQPGQVYRFNSAGKELGSFGCGISPLDFYFLP